MPGAMHRRETQSMQPSPPSPPKHRIYEDMQALISGTFFVALGISMFGHTGLLTGGLTEVVFLVHSGTGWNFGLLFLGS